MSVCIHEPMPKVHYVPRNEKQHETPGACPLSLSPLHPHCLTHPPPPQKRDIRSAEWQSPPSPLLLNPHLCHIHCGGRHEHFKTLCLRVKGDFVFLSAQISHTSLLQSKSVQLC